MKKRHNLAVKNLIWRHTVSHCRCSLHMYVVQTYAKNKFCQVEGEKLGSFTLNWLVRERSEAHGVIVLHSVNFWSRHFMTSLIPSAFHVSFSQDPNSPLSAVQCPQKGAVTENYTVFQKYGNTWSGHIYHVFSSSTESLAMFFNIKHQYSRLEHC